jgi:hypothetical protein
MGADDVSPGAGSGVPNVEIRDASAVTADGARLWDATAIGAQIRELENKIDRLKREAEAIRRREAAHAVRWIRETMALYGLTADDLGL